MPKKKNLEWRNCSEEELATHLKEWAKARDLKDSVIFLEGEMGAGKSTWARVLLSEIAPSQRSMGSPTFPLVQEYRASRGFPVYHIDLYRLKSDHELEDSGIESQIEEAGSTALVEWASMFESSFIHWFDDTRKKRKHVYLVRIENSKEDDLRNYTISEID
jgi:tRNA threonylcarbamoyladenosine biosynthesis protein TsaE